jgi:hypothetical protein
MNDQAEDAGHSIAAEFEADLARHDAQTAVEHTLVADLRAILEGPEGHTIGSLARVVEQLLGELAMAQSAHVGLGEDGLSSLQIEELGSVLAAIERERVEDAAA